MALWLFRNRFLPAGLALAASLLAVSPAAAGTVPMGAAVNYAFFSQPYINTFSFNGANKISGNVVAGADGQNSGSLNDPNAVTGTAYEDVVVGESNTASAAGIGSVVPEAAVLPVTLIDLSNGFLTLRGGVSDIFLMNDAGQFTMNGPSEILLAGGLTANHVLFNVEGAGDLVSISGPPANVMNGTIRELGSNVNIATNYSIQGIQGVAGFELNFQPYTPDVPEPATLALLGFGLAGILFTTKARRKANSQGREAILGVLGCLSSSCLRGKTNRN